MIARLVLQRQQRPQEVQSAETADVSMVSHTLVQKVHVERKQYYFT